MAFEKRVNLGSARALPSCGFYLIFNSAFARDDAADACAPFISVDAFAEIALR
jgi:hypothetical protein